MSPAASSLLNILPDYVCIVSYSQNEGHNDDISFNIREWNDAFIERLEGTRGSNYLDYFSSVDREFALNHLKRLVQSNCADKQRSNSRFIASYLQKVRNSMSSKRLYHYFFKLRTF